MKVSSAAVAGKMKRTMGLSAVASVIQEVLDLSAGKEWIDGTPIPGWAERISPRGVKIIELDIEADPEKRDPRFLEDARRRQRSLREFRREYLRDRTSAAGNAVYPEFANNGGIAYYCQVIPGFIKAQPVHRGWDLGGRCPAVYWGQVSPKLGRVFTLREWVPKDIHTPTLGQVVKFLSGEIAEADLDSHAKERVAQLREDPTVPKFPWFPPGTVFMDYAGPECFRRTFDVNADTTETSSYEILGALGIHLIAPRVSKKWRESTIRTLLTEQARDSGPMCVIDISCRFLIGALLGLLSYPKPTILRPVPDQPRKDGTYDNAHDAWGYLLINVKPLIDNPSSNEAGVPMEDRRDLPLAEPEEFILRAMPNAREGLRDDED